MVSKLSASLVACVTLFFVQNSAAKSLARPSGCGQLLCSHHDLDIEASGSAISSQFALPDGSLVTHSKETSISSDGVQQTYHQLKKEADRFVSTGHGGPVIGAHSSNFAIPPIPSLPLEPFYSHSGSKHESFSQLSKENEFGKKIISSLSPSSSQFDNFQAQNSIHSHSNSDGSCAICQVHTGVTGGKLEASYDTIVGNVVPSSSGSSSYEKKESSSLIKNSSQQGQPILFSNSLKPNTFTTNFVDLGNNYNHNGQGSETQVNYQETGSGHYKTEEIGYGLGPVSRPMQIVAQVQGPSAVHSSSYQKEESSSHVEQTGAAAVPLPAKVFVQQTESELAKQQQHQSGLQSPILYHGVPQNIPLESQSSGSHQSHYYESSSSSKTVSSSGGSNPIIIQSPPQKYVSSSNNGYNSASSSSISGGTYTQNPPETYYNGKLIHGASSSIYDHSRGDSNAETLCTTNCQPCTTCTYVHQAGAPVKNSYGVSTSFSSHSSTINGKTTENREAAISVNDNGKLDSYHVKTP